MTKAKESPKGYLAIILHAHLPYVVNHGTWPHGIEWLHEAAAETYLPLLRVLGHLQRDGVPANFNISFSPVLLEQLAHPHFIADFPRYLTRKVVAAREDEAFFIQAGDPHLTEIARFWGRFFTSALDDFRELNGDIVGAFRRFHQAGTIDIVTSGATHGYLPLLGTDESVRAQIRTGVDAHVRHIGRRPRGIWVPECGYRPAGFWNYPVSRGDGVESPGFERIGVEQALAESGLEYFFVDTHLVEESRRGASPYKSATQEVNGTAGRDRDSPTAQRNLYQTYFVDGTYGTREPVTVFPRDPSTGLQVWSGDTGYPGDANYLDFHKKRFPGGHRYWQVSGPRVDMGDKQVYWPQQAKERVKEHADHFVSLVRETLEPNFGRESTPVLCAPFDAELFGHWWFEGPMWLEAVCRKLHEHEAAIATIICSEYVDRYRGADSIAMQEGSWGAEGCHQVWMNPETSWTYTHIYSAELYTREVCTAGVWRNSDMGKRIVQQLCRELLLMESSDWQFLITTGAARDYGEMRFLTHHDQFTEIKSMWEAFEQEGTLNEHMLMRLDEIERRDSIFAEIDPGYWAVEAVEASASRKPGKDDSEAN